MSTDETLHSTAAYSAVDPGFRVGEGAPTSDAATFQRKCVQNERTWSIGGGHTPAAPPGTVTDTSGFHTAGYL